MTKEEQYKPYVVDVNKFDPVDLFERMKEESAARDKSRITNCYSIGNVDIRFVSAAESESDKEIPLAYDSISDIKGKAYYIARTTVLDRSDIEMLCIEKTSYRGNDQYLIDVLFKETSWDKVHDVTQDLINKKLAFIKAQTAISVPVVHEAIVDSARLSGDFDKTNMDWLVHDLSTTDHSPTDIRGKAHAEWLEKRIQKYPDDMQSLTRLAQLYAEKKPDCNKSTAIFEKIMSLDPERNVYPYLQLVDFCYREKGDYKRAITVYGSLLREKNMEPQDTIYLRMALAIAYAESGETQSALQELTQALADTQTLSIQYPWLENSPSKEIIEKEVTTRKAQMIKLIEAAMDKVKSLESK